MYKTAIYLYGNFVWACPYCAASDTIGTTISAYVPLAGIIISPFILVGLFITFLKKKNLNDDGIR